MKSKKSKSINLKKNLNNYYEIFIIEIFNLKNFTLLIKPKRQSIPIYLAAINQKMVNLTWELGDGVIFYLQSKIL